MGNEKTETERIAIVSRALVGLDLREPADYAKLSARLRGKTGSNRYPGGAVHHLAPDDDLAAIGAWIETKAQSARTRESYRRESNRLLVWAIFVRGRALSDLDGSDLYAYRRWLVEQDGQEHWPASWRPFRRRGASGSPGQDPAVEGRPFAPLSESSRRLAETVLHGLFEFLVDARYLNHNPYRLINKRIDHYGEDAFASPPPVARPVTLARAGKYRKEDKFLDIDLWTWLLGFVDDPKTRWPGEERLVERDGRAPVRDIAWSAERIERARFLVHFGFWAAPRRDEFARAVMGDLTNRSGQWEWHVIGKGAKAASVPLSQGAIEALMRYRASRGLPPLPTRGVLDLDAPLVSALPSRTSAKRHPYGKAVSESYLYHEMVRLFVVAAGHVPEGPRAGIWRHKLLSGSPHWLRRTYGTHAAGSGMLAANLQKRMRHSSPQTTANHYIMADPHQTRTEERQLAGFLLDAARKRGGF